MYILWKLEGRENTNMSSIPPRTFSEGTSYILKTSQHPDLLNDRHRRLTRRSSFDRIRQFNTYICSQNFYILPSLIAWMKTSQTVLQSHIKKSINSIKLIFVSFLLYSLVLTQLKLCTIALKALAYKTFNQFYSSDFVLSIEMLSIIVHHSVSLLIDNIKRTLFAFVIYVTLLAIFLQLGTCIFFMSKVCLPIGLIFMFVCLYIISHINVSVLFYYLKKQENQLVNKKPEKKPRKFVLGQKSISNVNLF